ncbi:MAG: lipopolysaccharide assembly protein LapA domain-containing protein [Betaproteobacteria bacterium]|nr:lipopolysaccharide assembly protein LapA domain-containing protein [Betaproteobacteria bacterium]
MRYLSWLIRLALFIILLGFAVRNSEMVTLNYYLGYNWRAPLILIILAFFVGGVVIGIGANVAVLWRQKREILALRREARTQPDASEHNAI